MKIQITRELKDLFAKSWEVSWPVTIIMFYEFIVGLSDVYVAGKISSQVQAAYGLAFQIYMVFIIIGIAISVGSGSVVARLFTSPDRKAFNDASATSLWLSVTSGAFFSCIALVTAPVIIKLFGVPDELRSAALPLLRIYSIAFIFDYILMATNGILRSCDSVRRSLVTMTAVCALNVALNFILAFKTPLGFKGIGWATVISLAAGAAMNAGYLKRLLERPFVFSRKIAKNILSISWPSGLLQVLWQAGAIGLFWILSRLPSGNVEIIAAFTNGLKIEAAIFMPAIAFNMANAAIVGNLLGEKNHDRAFKAGIVTAILGVGVVSVLTLAVMLNASRVSAFLSGDPGVIKESVRYIYIALLSEPFMAWGMIMGGALNGAGDTRSVMTRVAFSVWFVRLPLAYVCGITFGLGAVAIWWAMNISICVHSALLTIRYFSKKWIGSAQR